MAVRLVTAWMLVAILFSGCLGDSQPVEEAPVEEYGPERPTGAGWTRVIESTGSNVTSLTGIALDLERDDWEVTDGGRARVGFQIAPFGNLTGWALLVFDGGELVLRVVDVPFEGSKHLEHDLLDDVLAFLEPVIVDDLVLDGPKELDAVVVLQGSGGIAVRPKPGASSQNEPQSAASLLAAESGQPRILGKGEGFTFDAFIELAAYGGLGHRLIYGDMDADFAWPDPRPLTAAMDTTLTAPPGLKGYTYIEGFYLGADSHGLWDAEFAQERLEGVVAQDWFVSGVFLAELLLFGFPWFVAAGDAEGVSSQFHVMLANVDLIELFTFDQMSLGVPLETLIGHAGDWGHWRVSGLIAAPRGMVDNGNLVLEGKVKTVLVGVA